MQCEVLKGYGSVLAAQNIPLSTIRLPQTRGVFFKFFRDRVSSRFIHRSAFFIHFLDKQWRQASGSRQPTGVTNAESAKRRHWERVLGERPPPTFESLADRTPWGFQCLWAAIRNALCAWWSEDITDIAQSQPCCRVARVRINTRSYPWFVPRKNPFQTQPLCASTCHW